MADIRVADEVWIAAALLHREHPYRRSFQPQEILDRAKREGLHSPPRPGLQWHVYLHCVANRAPNGGDHRMLYETPDGGRRLYRTGDASHPARVSLTGWMCLHSTGISSIGITVIMIEELGSDRSH